MDYLLAGQVDVLVVFTVQQCSHNLVSRFHVKLFIVFSVSGPASAIINLKINFILASGRFRVRGALLSFL